MLQERAHHHFHPSAFLVGTRPISHYHASTFSTQLCLPFRFVPGLLALAAAYAFSAAATEAEASAPSDSLRLRDTFCLLNSPPRLNALVTVVNNRSFFHRDWAPSLLGFALSRCVIFTSLHGLVLIRTS